MINAFWVEYQLRYKIKKNYRQRQWDFNCDSLAEALFCVFFIDE